MIQRIMPCDIVQKGTPILRQKVKLVKDFSSPPLSGIITEMAEAMFKEPDGIGIAAPQIGYGIALFLVATDVLDAKALEKRLELGKTRVASIIPHGNYMVFINPFFEKLSTKKTADVEGCLSVRGLYGKVTRPEKATIVYYDERGSQKKRGASGLFARVLQHEMDHLNGVLFIDKAKDVQKIS